MSQDVMAPSKVINKLTLNESAKISCISVFRYICHQYFLYYYSSILLYTLQLATGATGLFSQGVTAVVHGCSVHALGHNLGEEIAFIMATLQEGTQSTGKYTRLHS